MPRGRVKLKSLQEGAPATALHLADVMVPPEQVAETVDFAALFPQSQPVEVEIGSGKGGFLVDAATTRPDHNFLGIEYVEKFAMYIADRIVRRALTNVRVLSVDASHLMIHRIPDRSIDVLHVYHPDPWPKKRHHKRRLFQPAFVAAVVRTLKPGGRWYIQTDHAEYFEQMKAVTRDIAAFEPIAFASADPASGSPVLQTNFAVRYGQNGESIYQMALQRKA